MPKDERVDRRRIWSPGPQSDTSSRRSAPSLPPLAPLPVPGVPLLGHRLEDLSPEPSFGIDFDSLGDESSFEEPEDVRRQHLFTQLADELSGRSSPADDAMDLVDALPAGDFTEDRGDLPSSPPPLPSPATGRSAAHQWAQISLPDTARSAGGGDRMMMRADEDTPDDGMNFLASASDLAQRELGSFYRRPLERRSIGMLPVLASHPRREPGAHATAFAGETGTRSATEYVDDLGVRVPDLSYEIGHHIGHGEGGSATQVARNLSAISQGANTEMMAYDGAVRDIPGMLVGSYGRAIPGTAAAQTVVQEFFHPEFPESPAFRRTVDAHRPRMTRGEVRETRKRAREELAPDVIEGAADVMRAAKKARLE